MNDAVVRSAGRQLVRESLNQSGFVPSDLALKNARVQSGLSIQQLANLAGLSYTAIRATEHDLYPPTRKHVDAVMSAVGRVGLMTTVVGVGLDREVWIRVAQAEPTPTTKAVSPVHRLRLTVFSRSNLWQYEVVKDGETIEPQPQMAGEELLAGLDKSTAIIYATNVVCVEVGINANFCDFTTDADCTRATIEVLTIEGKNILVAHSDEPDRFYHADADDLPVTIAQEIAETIRDMNWEECDRYVAANGRTYRW